MKTIKAYWFEPADGVLQYGDGRKPVVGETHEISGKPAFCKNGLHGSARALDALKYAASNNIWIVELSGEMEIGDDKIAATKRTYIKRVAAEKILFECSRRFALSVAHLWDMPEVVREFLETGELTLRAAAGEAAGEAAWAVREAVAWAAAWAAREAVARAAAWDAAGEAAWAVARAVARAAAWDAREASAGAAREAAAWAAAWAAREAVREAVAWDAAGEAAWAVARAVARAAAWDAREASAGAAREASAGAAREAAARAAAAGEAAGAAQNTLLESLIEREANK